MSPLSTIRAILAHPANRGQALSALARYFWWQGAKRTWLRHHDLPFHGLKLRCYPDSHSASAALYFSGLPDFREMAFIRRYLRPGDCFVDVGANIGVYTLLAAALVGPGGNVHAFEPAPRTLMRLRENVSINSLANVHCHGIALTDHCGRGRLTNTHDDCVAGLAPAGTGTGQGGDVECSTLDVELPGVSMAMLKIDVEGAEPLALRGARTHMQQGNPPVLQIEMDGYCRRYGIGTHDFMCEIEGMDYELAIYDVEENRLVATRKPWEHGVRNILAVHTPRRAEVASRLAEADSRNSAGADVLARSMTTSMPGAAR